LFPHHWLRTISTVCSDHASLLLHMCAMSAAKGHFKFEAIWPHFPGFLDAVAEEWRLTLQGADPFRVLGFKLCNTTKVLKGWNQKLIGSVRLQLSVTREVIFRLEQQLDRMSSPCVLS
jgi:hypothetical protein